MYAAQLFLPQYFYLLYGFAIGSIDQHISHKFAITIPRQHVCLAASLIEVLQGKFSGFQGPDLDRNS